MGLHSQSWIRMKLLILLAVVALAQAAPDADALLYYRTYGHYPAYYYGHLGYPFIGRKMRDAEAAPDADALLYYRTYGHYPAYYYGHYPYIFGRKRRDADAGAAPDADADALLYYRTYGYYPAYYYGHYPLLGR